MKHTKLNTALSMALACVLCAPASGQFGGKAGDVVFYTVTYNGSGEFQAMPPGSTNSAATLASIKVTHTADVPYSRSDPFPLFRQVMYMTPQETFQVGTDYANTVGLERLNIHTVRVMQITGGINISGNISFPNAFITLPQGLAVVGDLTLEDARVITWFPAAWPFIVTTNQPGPFPCPPGVLGFNCLFATPGAIQLPNLMPWISLSSVYAADRWPLGIDQKVLAQEPGGVTIRHFRVRPGRQTPLIRTAGHTHLFVLQGAGVVTPAGGMPMPMVVDDYTLIPENAPFTISNPVPYQGPTNR